MTQISTYVERIEIVFDESASIEVIQVNEAMKIDGVVRQITPVAASSVTDPKVKAILQASSQAVTAERDALKTSLSTMTEDRDAQKAIADTVPGLQEQLATLASDKAALQAEVERLTALVPPPLPERSIYPRELLGRLTKAEIVDAIRTDDEDVIFAVANLQTTVSPVLLDSDEVRMMIGSLVVAGILTPERMAEVLA